MTTAAHAKGYIWKGAGVITSSKRRTLRHCSGTVCYDPPSSLLPPAHNFLASLSLLSPTRPNFFIKFAHPSAAPRPLLPHSVHDILVSSFAPTPFALVGLNLNVILSFQHQLAYSQSPCSPVLCTGMGYCTAEIMKFSPITES